MGSKRHLLSAGCYWVGCVLLIPGSYLLKVNDAENGIILYIVACLLLTIGALIDLIAALLAKPSAEEQKNLINKNEGSAKAFNDWKLGLYIQIFYTLGGIFFFVGSVLYWPYFVGVATAGTWVFRTGSFCYLAGSLIAVMTTIAPYEGTDSKYSLSTGLWLCCLFFYMFGSVCFIIGGILSQCKIPFSSDMWVVGSWSFTIGASFTLVEIYRSW